MSEPFRLKILVVEDTPSLRHMFVNDLRNAFENADIIGVESLEAAHDALRNHQFDAIITDCGFPAKDGGEDREHHGVTLVKELCRPSLQGTYIYGTYHSLVPIAFNSAELTSDKTGPVEALHKQNVHCFTKGVSYPGFKRVEPIFTSKTVTQATIEWLTKELTEDKVRALRERAQQLDNTGQSKTGKSKGWNLFR